MSQCRVMTSRCDVMPSYKIEAILVCLQFSHAYWPCSHTYCSIVVYYELVNTITEIKDWMSSNRLKLNPSKTQYIWIGNKMQLAKIWQTGTAATLSRDCLRNKCHGPGCRHRRGSEDGHSCWKNNSFVFLSAATDTDNTSIPQWQRYTNSHTFIRCHKGWLLQLGPIWHHCSTDRTSSENFECSGSSRASNSEVCTSIGVGQRQSALASSCTANKIQDPATGRKLHQPKSTVVSAGTLCAGFSGAGASALTVCWPALPGGQSLSVIIDAEAGICCCWTDGVERFASGLHVFR